MTPVERTEVVASTVADVATATRGNDEQCDNFSDGVQYGDYDGEYDDQEEEIEEITDDLPMQVAPRLFLGSIDAARNEPALRKADIAFTLALLSTLDHANGDGIAATRASAHVSADDDVSDANSEGIVRDEIALEDALDEALFRKLPSILTTLNRILADAERLDKNVLVHCVAGRSRSAAVVAAWLIAQSPRQFERVEQAVEVISNVRPWIAINAHFERELQRFHAVVCIADTCALPRDVSQSLLQPRTMLPRVDFGMALVPGILAGNKTITMRLLSDCTNDANSDLQDVCSLATVLATTASSSSDQVATATTTTTQRRAFALLRIDRVEIANVVSLDAQDLAKTGAASTADVLRILTQFYPHVTAHTPLLMLHFMCIARVDGDDTVNEQAVTTASGK